MEGTEIKEVKTASETPISRRSYGPDFLVKRLEIHWLVSVGSLR